MVLLQLRRCHEHAVDPSLHQAPDRLRSAGAIRVEARDVDAVALAAGLLLGACDEAAEVGVAEVARHQAHCSGALHDEASCLEVGDVRQISGGPQDPGSRLRRHGALAVQDLARGLKAHAGPGRDVLHGDASGRPSRPHAAAIMHRERTFA